MPIGTADIFTADYSTRNGNWQSFGANNANHTISHKSGGGPNGLNALQIDFIPAPAGGAGDYGLGGNIHTLSDPGFGVARYYRYFEYHDITNNWNANGSVVWRFKRLMIADPAGSGRRMILNTNSEAGASHLEAIFDGSSVGSSGNIAKGQWHAIQVEVIFNNTSPNSTVKVWLNNDTYASPNVTVSYSQSTPPGSAERGDVNYGAYTNHGLASGGIYIMKEAGFRVASTYDSSWNYWLINGDGGGDITPPNSPTGVIIY